VAPVLAGYYLPGDGSCAACPVVTGLWDRYRSVILLLCGVLAVAACFGLLLVMVVRCYGGTLARQCAASCWHSCSGLSQRCRRCRSRPPSLQPSLPTFLATLFRGVAVLQLDEVLLPPACTGAYAFESQVCSG